MDGRISMTSAPVETGRDASSKYPSSSSSQTMNSILNGTHGQGIEDSFKEFCERPENRRAMEAHQRKEFRKAEKVQRKMAALKFQEAVIGSEYDIQKNIAPFLDYPCLRNIIQSFSNDPNKDFAKWAGNGRVLAMLTQAKEMIDSGKIGQDEMEEMLLRYLESEEELNKEIKLKTKQQIRLTTDQLVAPLNEHLTERRRGNEAYKSRDFSRAMHHYGRALAIVNYVVGVSTMDQKEVDDNKCHTLLNIAAVHIAEKEYGAAIASCTEALELRPNNVKALLRRARAYAERRETGSAEADLERVKDIQPWNEEAEQIQDRIALLRKCDRETDKTFAKGAVR